MGAALPIADHHDVLEVRVLARRVKNGRLASRMAAIANALDGMTRLAAARSAGMDRQTLRDWVIRDNADGIDGLCDQPKGHNPEKLTESGQAVLLAKVFQTPDPTRDGTCAWTLADLCDFAEMRFGKRLSTSGMWGMLPCLGLCHRWWQKGKQPPGRCDKRFERAYIFAAAAPETSEAFVCSRIKTPSSMPAAKPGMPSQMTPTASNPYAISRG
ncbi:MAG: helix-turn-helix domain-containing protein [Geminicoccaceae bacterium]